VGLEQIVGESPLLIAALKQIPVVAKFDVGVLILGETGTGKEVFARAIHYHSRRAAGPFAPVNCGALPADLLENEFFGHEPGAYTGATGCHRGLLRETDGGTIFLDEVDCLPLAAQVKLLRFLQDGQFRPLGCERLCSANVRVMAASNADLAEAVKAGRFRADLYYRLNVVSLRLPPLRERDDDITLLARHFLARCRDRFGGGTKTLSAAAVQKLIAYNWPGNVRELENVIQRAFVLAQTEILDSKDFSVGIPEANPADTSFQTLKARLIDEFEQAYLRRVLRAHAGNITKAAQSAGKDRRAFWELMRKHQIGARSGVPRQDSLVRQRGDPAGQISPGADSLEKPPEIDLDAERSG
jgi:DNA-binding NtrC family response regulator